MPPNQTAAGTAQLEQQARQQGQQLQTQYNQQAGQYSNLYNQQNATANQYGQNLESASQNAPQNYMNYLGQIDRKSVV